MEVQFSTTQLDSLKQFVKFIKYNPSILDTDENLSFFKDFLINDCGATKLVIPPQPESATTTTSTTTITSDLSTNNNNKEQHDNHQEEEEGFLIKEVSTTITTNNNTNSTNSTKSSSSLIVEVIDSSSTTTTASSSSSSLEASCSEPPAVVEVENDPGVMKEITSNAMKRTQYEDTDIVCSPLLIVNSNNKNTTSSGGESTPQQPPIIEPSKELILTTANDSKYLNIMNLSDSSSASNNSSALSLSEQKNMKLANECIRKGNDLFKKADYQLAAIYYGKSIECSNGESAMTFIKRAECLAMLNKPLSVRRDCTQAIKLNPDAGKAYNLRGKALLALGRVELARQDLEMFKKLNSEISNMEPVDKLLDQINDIKSTTSSAKVENKTCSDNSTQSPPPPQSNPSTTNTSTTIPQGTTPKTPSQSNTTKQNGPTTNTTTTSSSKGGSSSTTSNNSKANSSASAGGGSGQQVPNFVNPHVMKLVAGDETLMRAFQNPRLVNAINEIAMNPSAFLKYNHDVEVVTMFKKFTEIIGKANK